MSAPPSKVHGDYVAIIVPANPVGNLRGREFRRETPCKAIGAGCCALSCVLGVIGMIGLALDSGRGCFDDNPDPDLCDDKTTMIVLGTLSGLSCCCSIAFCALENAL